MNQTQRPSDLPSAPPGKQEKLPDKLKKCVEFHGHLCPGLTYGFLIATKATELLSLDRALDEEVVAVSENDSCAIDSLQVLLGTTAGKGNLVIDNIGKNVFTVYSRKRRKAYRFSRTCYYDYSGPDKAEFDQLEAAFVAGTATHAQRRRQKHLKSLDLVAKPFDQVFSTTEVDIPSPPYAPLSPSTPCAECSEMTMRSKMVETEEGELLCLPCASGRD